ncbi:hypothetical protein [Kytococcus sp. Marseille-QA3725]
MSLPLRVLSVPAGHPYVQHAIGGTPGVVLLPDPPVPGAPPGRWWPSPALDPAWLRAHHEELDLVHVHFGFEHLSPQQVADWVEQVHRLGPALVVTVHDLALPHVQEQGPHRERLRHLVDGADAVLTLTPGAAAEVREATGRGCTVVPHPPMEPTERIRTATRPERPDGPLTVGVHLKSLRANAGRVPLLEELAGAAADLGAGTCRLEVLVHEQVVRPGEGHAPDVAGWVADPPAGVTVRVIEPLDDAEFTAYLEHLDVSVVPHRWGTHSGWVEQCHDLGVVPVASALGHLAEQGVDHLYRWRGDRPHRESLRAALAGAVEQARAGRTARAAAGWAAHREAQVCDSRRAHARIYRRAVQARSDREAP